MSNNKRTIFQSLESAITGNWNAQTTDLNHINSYDFSNSNPNGTLYKTTDKDDYETTKLELQQDRYLKDRWVKANVNMNVTAYAGLSNVKLMFRDADLMSSAPEIAAALDIYADEATIPFDNGQIVKVQSKSDRVKSILEDLFSNRLNLNLTARMIIRATAKYGNQYMLLDIDHKHGVKGWKQMPVFNVERIENGIQNPYVSAAAVSSNQVDPNKVDMATKFIWTDADNGQVPFRDWQVAHFRLINDSLYLPYGCSALNGARRHWRQLAMMEDMMLIYRLERSMERRVYKIYVGAIDDADVQAYVEDIANQFKRTPIIDPMTGQIDLRKNIMPVWRKTPIPLLDGRTITIEQLAQEFENGNTNYVYSVQDKTHKIVPGKVIWCGKNYTANKMVKITLDDDSYMVMAPEHEVIMRDGSKKRADELEFDEFVMSFQRGMYKNHENYTPTSYKVKTVEFIDGDDVYCMTVVGLNGEEDRHNFALRTFKNNNEWNESGCFVSNCIDNDIFLPVRSENAPTPIDTLAAGNNLTAMDDIKYVQNKVLTALRVPKQFLNFEESTGDGGSLALQDIRFTRAINGFQQAFLMELTKVATIHLFLLGFNDDLTNFSLSMNNPSTQAEQLKVDTIAKKIGAVRDAVSDPGNGVPAMSLQRALKTIMGWSEKEIKENLEEIRLEKALAAELEKTTQIITRTHLFDRVDRIYGDPGADYQDAQGGGQEEGGDMGGAPGGGGGFGDGLDGLDAPGGGDDTGELAGNEGMEPTADMGGGEGLDAGGDMGTPMESVKKKENLLVESFDTMIEKYIKEETKNDTLIKRANVYDKTFLINEEIHNMIGELDDFLKEK